MSRKVSVKCESCGSRFVARKIERAKGWGRFCSRACNIESQSSHRIKPCEWCKTPFRPKSDRGLTFCSRACYEAERRSRSTSYPKIGGRHAHRVIMECKIGRSLNPGELVHHLDEDKKNFCANNLEIVTRAKHANIHFSGLKPSPATIAKRVATRRKNRQQRGYW